MKRTLLLLCALVLLGVNAAWAATTTYTVTKANGTCYLADGTVITSGFGKKFVSSDDVLTFESGTNQINWGFTTDNGFRINQGNTTSIVAYTLTVRPEYNIVSYTFGAAPNGANGNAMDISVNSDMSSATTISKGGTTSFTQDVNATTATFYLKHNDAVPIDVTLSVVVEAPETPEAPETVTWTSGKNFNESTGGNFSTGWFSFVSPFNGNVNSITVNLGTSNTTGGIDGGRKTAFLAISSDLKSSTSGLTSADFIAISNNKCGTTDSKVTLNFDSGELAGGVTYYCYFVTEDNGSYTLKNQRYHVVDGSGMSLGVVGSTTAGHTNYTIPLSATMTLTGGGIFRIRGVVPSDGVACYLCSNSTNEDKLWKSKEVPLISDSRYVWKAFINKGVILQNANNLHYISQFTSASTNGANVNYLNATSEENAVAFTLSNRVDAGFGYVTLKTQYNSTDTWLNNFTNRDNYVGCHNISPYVGDQFLFIQLKKVTFSETVAVNAGDAVSTIYLAVDGSDSFTLPSSKLYSINGAAAVTNTEAAATIAAAGTSDITVTVSDNPSRNVTYTLNWSDGTQLSQVTGVTANLNAPAAEFLPSAMATDCVTLSYSPETITNETNEVVVTATWNGPFQLSDSYASAKWYTIGIHSSYESANHIWKYVSDGSTLVTDAVPTDAYYALSDANCFAFTGNPYTGITIYNKAAGSDMTVTKANDNSQATVSATGSLFVPQASSEANKTVAAGYACFLVKDGSYYLNCNASQGYKIYGWAGDTGTSGNDAGSTCWFLPAGQYYLNYIDGLALSAPVGAVGTSNYFTTVANATEAKNTLSSLRSTIASALYSDMATLATVNNQLDPVRNAGKIALTGGYYQIINAFDAFVTQTGTRRRMIFNGSAIGWTNDMDANNINAIFKLVATGAENAYSIYSGNGQNYLSNGGGVLGNATNVTITEAASGTARYSFYLAEGYNNNHHYLHTLGHDSGRGTSGSLTAWDADANSASAWYIVPVESVDLTLNDGGDGNYYATACLPFTVTLDGCEAYTLTLNSAKTGLTLSEAMTEVPAGMPVLLCGTDATATANIAADAATSAPRTTTSLIGTYTDLTVTAGTDLFLGKAGDKVGFYKWNGTTLKANRAYLPASALEGTAGVKGFAIQFDTATAIEALQQQRMANGQVFNLAGQRVSKPAKGIYVVNGKKVAIK